MTPAIAAQPLTAAEFEAYVAGRTITYFSGGAAFGHEQYRSDRRVIWAFEGDDCIDGEWYPRAPDLICFIYEDLDALEQCWHFYLDESGLQAEFVGDDGARRLYETARRPEPLFCPGPRVGV